MSDNSINGDSSSRLKILMKEHGVDEAKLVKWARKMKLTQGLSLNSIAIEKILRSWESVSHLVNLENRSVQEEK